MWRKDERGSATLELVIVFPALLLFLSVLIFGGRVAIAGQSVQQAAEQAARQASISRSAGEARDSAQEAAERTLEQQNLKCTSVRVQVNTAGFEAALGQRASVRARVVCRVQAGDLLIPGLPGSRRVVAVAVSPIDTWRQR